MRVLIAAGNTREMIDPVRFISNISSGRMGVELAKESARRGFPTTLISGPTCLKPPRRVRFVPIITSGDLERALREYFPHCDILFMPSAVCDFRPLRVAKNKIRRRSAFALALVSTPDILKGLAARKKKQLLVGFCLETGNLYRSARRKLREKKLDYIVGNLMGKGVMPFGDAKTSVLILGKDGRRFSLRNVTKSRVAKFLFDLLMVSRRCL